MSMEQDQGINETTEFSATDMTSAASSGYEDGHAVGYGEGLRAGFLGSWDRMERDIHATAMDKGWWDKERNDGELIALMHSELSEALEALRHGNPPDDKVPDFSGVEAELADVVIRIMDAAAARGWRVGDAIQAKAAMNKTRARMHGGKAF